MKKIGLLSVLTFLFLQNAHAAITCEPTYEGKPFVQVTIWSGLDGYGPADCEYKEPEDHDLTVLSFPKTNEYYPISGHWLSTMPGYRWCSTEDGNTAETCRFAIREM